MESIQLSLNQVNFEEQTLDGASDELHSFSNLVSYDSDFNPTAAGLPIIAKKLEYQPARRANGTADELDNSFLYLSDHLSDDSLHQDDEYRLYARAKQNLSQRNDTAAAPTSGVSDMSASDTWHEVSGMRHHGRLPQTTSSDAVPTDGSFNRFLTGSLMPTDTFTAFTESVEALALQKSVIGSSNVIPASPEEVAKVIAATQARMRQSSQSLNGSFNDYGWVQSQQQGIDQSAPSSITNIKEQRSQNTSDLVGSQNEPSSKVSSESLSQSSTVTLTAIHSSESGVKERHSSSGHTDTSTSIIPPADAVINSGDPRSLCGFGMRSLAVGTLSENSGQSSDVSVTKVSTGDSIDGKELIRVPPDTISKDTKKAASSGWFFGNPWSEKQAKAAAPPMTSKPRDGVDSENKDADVKTNKETKQHFNSAVLKPSSNNQPTEQNVSSAISDLQAINSESDAKFCQRPSNTHDIRVSDEKNQRSLSDNAVAALTGDSSPLESNMLTVQTSSTATSRRVHFEDSTFNEHSFEVTGDHAKPLLLTTSNNTTVDSKHCQSYAQQQSSTSSVARGSASLEGSFENSSTTVNRNVSEVTHTKVSQQQHQQFTRSSAPAAAAPNEIVADSDSTETNTTESLRREKAKLEGRIEVLQFENKEMLHERTELQSKVASLSQELSLHKTSSRNLVGDRDSLTADLETLRQNRSRLEAVIMDAHKLLEDKDEELRMLNRELDESRAVADRYHDKMNEACRELKSREATTNDLKNKIAELYVDFQTTNQNKILADNEVQSLHGELKALAAAKEWYKEQLQAFQREKIELQAEVTRIKLEMIAQGTAIERLKAENTRVKRRVAETEQKSLSEKQGLARHLEMIEADMMEREAAFAQLKRERQAATREATADALDGETVQSFTTEDLQVALNDAKRLQLQLNVLQHEHTEVLKRLALSQESIIERDRIIERVERDAVEVETKLKQLELELGGRDEVIARLKHERSTVEVELASVTEEKRVFDTSLKSLKEDMAVVESRFRTMKSELASKQNDIDRLQEQLQNHSKQRTSLTGIENLEEICGIHTTTTKGAAMLTSRHHTNETQTDASELDITEDTNSQIVLCLKAEKATLENKLSTSERQLAWMEAERSSAEQSRAIVELELASTKDRLALLQKKLAKMAEEKIALEELLAETTSHKELAEKSLTRAQLQMSALSLESNQTCVNSHSQTYSVPKQDIVDSHSQTVSVARADTADIHSQTVVEAKQDIVDAGSQTADVADSQPCTIAYSQGNIEQITDSASCDDKLLQTIVKPATALMEVESHSSVRSAETKIVNIANTQLLSSSAPEVLGATTPEVSTIGDDSLVRLTNENRDLQTKLGDLQRESHKEIAKLKTKALKLTKQLETAIKEHQESTQVYERQIQNLSEHLAATEEQRTRLENELEDVRRRAAMDRDAIITELQNDLMKTKAEVEQLTNSRREMELQLETIVQRTRLEINEYIQRTTILENELHITRTYIEERRATDEKTAELALELEKERGRLAGILHSHSVLKEHASELEQTLANSASSVVELNSHAREELEKKDREINGLVDQIKLLDDTLSKERQNIKDARKQLLTEKGSHIKVKRELQQLTTDHEQLSSELEQLRLELVKGGEELEVAHKTELDLKADIERIMSELKTLTMDRDRLMRERIEWDAREATMREQMQSLGWKHSEKEAEIRAAAERLELIEERHQFEIKSVTQTLQSTSSELMSLRDEMASVTREKAELKAQLARLKEALRATLEQQPKVGDNLSLNYDELDRLLNEAAPPAIESKPLSFLQATLSGLRGEISCLQLQVDEHTTAVQSSSQAWKELEAQVLDLRQVCQTSAADRAMTQKLLEETEALVGSGVLSNVQAILQSTVSPSVTALAPKSDTSLTTS